MIVAILQTNRRVESSNIFAKVSQLDICKSTRLHHSFLL